MADSYAASGDGGARKVPSLPPPRPKSPPEYPDLYGKRRELARVQMLEREIGFLEDELKFVQSLQPASLPCKEVADFVIANSDPFMPTTAKAQRSCRFWKWLCGTSSCLNFSWICCCCCCSHQIELPNCCNCNCSNKCMRVGSCTSCCSRPKLCCSGEEGSKCCKMKPSCSNCRCVLPSCSNCVCKNCCCVLPSCSNCVCNGCVACYPKCPTGLNLCSCCTRYSCHNCYICC